MSAEAVSETDAAAAVVAETAVEIAAEQTVEGKKDRLKTWYGSERPCVGERNWASVESLGGKNTRKGKREGEKEKIDVSKSNTRLACEN